jgi:CubicO group peptidase (beta-lactamase class C family)
MAIDSGIDVFARSTGGEDSTDRGGLATAEAPRPTIGFGSTLLDETARPTAPPVALQPFSAQIVAALAPHLEGAPERFELCAAQGNGRMWAVRAGGPANPATATPVLFPIASVTKILFAYAVCVAVEEQTVTYEDEVARGAPPGVILADLLAHCAGLPIEGRAPFAKPRQRRIYSNTGIEIAAQHLEGAAGLDFASYIAEAVLEPVGMANTYLGTSAAYGARSTAADLAIFGAELLHPRCVHRNTLDMATTPYLPELRGVLPGFGRQNPNPWGLGFEVRGHKRPHWTGCDNSPRTFGHFGQSGAFLWVDPEIDLAVSFVGDRPFDSWAFDHWGRIADVVINGLVG